MNEADEEWVPLPLGHLLVLFDGCAPRTARSISSGAPLCRAVVPNDRLTGPPVVRALTALRLFASRGGSSEGEKRSL